MDSAERAISTKTSITEEIHGSTIRGPSWDSETGGMSTICRILFNLKRNLVQLQKVIRRFLKCETEIITLRGQPRCALGPQDGVCDANIA